MPSIKRYFASVVTRIVKHSFHISRLHSFKGLATFHPSVIFSEEASIVNGQNNPSAINIGENCSIGSNLLVFGYGGKIEIGNNTFMSKGTNIWSGKLVKVGNYVLIAHNVNIIDNISHPVNYLERRKDWEFSRVNGFRQTNDFDLKDAPINIGDDAWIGHSSTILRGVNVGKGAIVGANTIVTKDVPDYAIIVGNPFRIIGYSNEQ